MTCHRLKTQKTGSQLYPKDVYAETLQHVYRIRCIGGRPSICSHHGRPSKHHGRPTSQPWEGLIYLASKQKILAILVVSDFAGESSAKCLIFFLATAQLHYKASIPLFFHYNCLLFFKSI